MIARVSASWVPPYPLFEREISAAHHGGRIDSQQPEDGRREVGELALPQFQARSGDHERDAVGRMGRVRASVLLQLLLGVPVVGSDEADAPEAPNGVDDASEAAVGRLHR